MSKVKFQLNSAGVRQLMKSEEMKTLLSTVASGIQGKCGDGYKHDLHDGRNRANAMIWAESTKARKDNLNNNTILKAVR